MIEEKKLLFLSAKNIGDALEFVSVRGGLWRRRSNGLWAQAPHDSSEYAGRSDDDVLCGDYVASPTQAVVTQWKMGRDPQAPNAFHLGAVLPSSAVPPKGTVVSDGSQHVTCFGTAVISNRAGVRWVVVCEAPPPPAEEPWRTVVLEVRGEGNDAEIRFPDGSKYRSNGIASTVAKIAKKAAPAPEPEDQPALTFLECCMISSGNRIGAIKSVRARLGFSLKEAKDLVAKIPYDSGNS